MTNAINTSSRNAMVSMRLRWVLSFALAVGLLVGFTSTAQAATITSTAAGGTWTTGGTWVGGVAPAAGDTVIIATTGAGAVNIAANLTQTAAGSVTVNNGATLTTSGGTITFGALTINAGGTVTMYRALTVLGATNITGTINFGSTNGFSRLMTFNGAVTLNSGAVWNETTTGAIPTFTFANNLTNNATTFTTQTGAHTFSGTAMTLSGATAISIPNAAFTGTYTNNDTLTVTTALTGAGGLTNSATGTLNIGGTSTITTLTATAAGNTVNYNGAAQTVKATTYNNLTLRGSGAKTLTNVGTITGDLTISGTATATTAIAMAVSGNLDVQTGTTFTAAGFNFAVTGTTTVGGTLAHSSATGTKTYTGLVTINSGGSWTNAGNAAITFGGGLTNNGSFAWGTATQTVSGGDLTYAGTAWTTGTGSFTFSASGQQIVCDGTHAFTIPTLTVNNSVTNNCTGGLTVSTSLAGSSTLMQGTSALLNIGGTATIAGLTATASPNTVNYTSTTAAQTVLGTTYHNLTINKTGQTATLGGAITTNGTLNIAAGTLNTSGSNYAIALNGDFTNSGTFSANASPITIGGTNATQSIAGFTTTGALSCTKTNGTATLQGNVSAASLTLNGTGVTLNLGSATHSISGNLNVIAGILDAASSNFTVSGITSVTDTLTHSFATGTKIYTGLVTVNSGGTWNNSGNSAITFRGGLTNNGTFTAGTGVYTFDTNSQAIGGNATSIPSLTIIGVTLTNNITSGGLTVGTALSGSGGLTQAANAILNIGGTSGITTLTATANPNTVNYNGSATQTVKGTTYNILKINDSAGATLGAAATVTTLTIGDVTANSNFDDGGFGVTSAGTLNLTSGTFRVAAASYPAFATNTIGSGTTVEYYGVGAQMVSSAPSYQNLLFSGAGTKTLGGATTVNGNLNISAGTLDVSASNYALNVKGNWTNSGTFNPRSGTVTFNGAGAQTINSVNTWYGLAVSGTAARTVKFQSGVAQTISANGSLAFSGASGQLLTLAPLTAGSPWLLIFNGATQSISYVSVSYSNAGGGATINADATNINGGNNTNWHFGTTTAVSSGTNPSTYGQSVTFTATVTGSGGTPTGTVTFKDGAATLGTGTLNGSGVATYATTTLTAASHSITAVYGGDSTFAASTSSALAQTVNQAALTITATTNAKTYDGTTSAAATPSVSGLQGTDTVTGLSEAYADKNTGTGKTVAVTAYVVNDGNGGNNYTVTTVNDTTGIITSKALTVSGITANDKIYDGNTTATLNTGGASLNGVVNPDDVTLNTAGAAGSFADANVGTGKTVTVSGLSITGADTGNYSLTQPVTSASITDTNPVFSATSPATDSYINTASVGYTLDKLVVNGTGAITFTRTGGTADPGSPRTYTLTGADMTSGSHSINTGLALVNGTIYTLTFDIADDQGYAASTVTNTNILYDSSAALVTLTAPAASSYVNNVNVSYTLSEGVSAGSIVYTWESGPADGASPHTYTLTGAELTSGSHVVATGLTLVDGAIYTVAIANVVDLAGNPTSAVSNTSVKYDITAIAITGTSPVADSAVATATVSYTLSKQAASGTVTFTRTGGAPDGSSPQVYALSGSDLTEGAHTVNTGLGLVDGTIYTVSFNATDLAGNIATTVSNASVIFDVSAPEGFIILNNGVPMTASGTVSMHLESTDVSGVIGYFISETDTTPAVDDPLWIPVTSAASLVVDGTFALSSGDGIKTVYAWFKDGLGHVSNAVSAYITVESSGTAFSVTQVPGMVISMLPDGSHTTDATLNVTGMVADLSSVQQILVGSDPIVINPDGSFSVAIGLVDGDNLIQITIIDLAGNQATVSRTIILDPLAPALAVTSPVDGLRTALNHVDVTGSTDAAAVVTVFDSEGGWITPIRSGDDFSGSVNLRAGLNTILITSIVAGQTQTAKRTVFYDFQKPSLALTSPAKDVTITNGSITITGVATALTNVTVTVTADGVDYHPAVDGSGNFTQALTFAQEGIYPVIVTATDENTTTSTVQRNVRFQRGSIVINKGAVSTTATKVTLNLSYVPAPPATSVSTMQLLFDNKAWAAPVAYASTKTITLPSGDGVKSVFVQFTDNTGAKSAFYSDTIILDSKVPVGSITINNGDAVTTSANVTLTLSVTDVNGVVKMQFSNDGKTWSALEPFAKTKAYTLSVGSPPTYGSKKVSARFVDSSGKVSATVSDSITYAASTTGSTVAEVTIKNGDTYTTSTSVPVAITLPGTYIQMRTSKDGTSWSSWGTTKASITFTLPSGDGVKTVYVQGKAADSSTSPIYSDSIILDTIAPKGTIQINSGAYSTNNRNVTLTLTATDLNGVKEMQVSVTNTDWATAPWEPFSGTKNVTLTSGEGTKTVWVKYKDNAGKISAAVTDTILVDTLAPTGTVKINGGATVITSRTAKLSISASGATYMRLSLDGGATWGDWEPYATSKSVTLPAGDGTKTVQVYFRDLTGNVSPTPAGASATYAQAQAPATITVPASDADGKYTVTWGASPTPGVSYLLQEATNASFTTGVRTAYSGTAVSANITSRVQGMTYYYRVQAKKTNYESSSWTTAGNSCNVGSSAMPSNITVPKTDADGDYTVSWGASATAGASYVVEEATNNTFSSNLRQVYSGTDRTVSITGNAGGGTTYYYRVKAQKTGFPDSAWKAGANGCKVGT